jgi:hypothetical protein
MDIVDFGSLAKILKAIPQKRKTPAGWQGAVKGGIHQALLFQ